MSCDGLVNEEEVFEMEGGETKEEGGQARGCRGPKWWCVDLKML